MAYWVLVRYVSPIANFCAQSTSKHASRGEIKPLISFTLEMLGRSQILRSWEVGGSAPNIM